MRHADLAWLRTAADCLGKQAPGRVVVPSSVAIRIGELLPKLVDAYEQQNNAINWETTCTNCAQLLNQLNWADMMLETIGDVIDRVRDRNQGPTQATG
jgi:hypothetical protein